MLEDVCEKIAGATIDQRPFPHFVIDDFVPSSCFSAFNNDPSTVEEKLISCVQNNSDHHYDHRSNGLKYMIQDIESADIGGIRDIFTSQAIADAIQKKFSIPHRLSADPTFDGGGLTLSPPDSFLRYHGDFNWSSKAEKYRYVNAILYLNANWNETHGGCLHLIDNNTETVEKIVPPIFNRCAIFITSKETPHGVSINKNGFNRLSLNSYFYCDHPPKVDQDVPHKTLWKNSK